MRCDSMAGSGDKVVVLTFQRPVLSELHVHRHTPPTCLLTPTINARNTLNFDYDKIVKADKYIGFSSEPRDS
jgi:hypothetical protein